MIEIQKSAPLTPEEISRYFGFGGEVGVKKDKEGVWIDPETRSFPGKDKEKSPAGTETESTALLAEQKSPEIQKAEVAVNKLKVLERRLREELTELRGRGAVDLSLRVKEEELNALRKDLEEWERYRSKVTKGIKRAA